jgi:selenide, water dikinase
MKVKTDLLRFTDHGGCSSKIPAGQLEEILRHLPVPVDRDILVNIDTHDDAGVYRLNDDLALVFTTDFFPPVCSDPYEFGQIAAANSISDIYAMGGTPLIALNIMMFPATGIPMEAFGEILKGGYDKAAEAGVRIIGGHTIDDQVPKYGLAVVGLVNPKELVTNSGAKKGDKLILTKPVGTGIIMAAHRLLMATDEELSDAKQFMKMLNRDGASVMKKYNIAGATDITGFGLAGHALKMARASGVSMKIDMRSVPLIGSTLKHVDDGCIPGACFSNLGYAENAISFTEGIDYNLTMIAFDAQTSGGLLISVPSEKADDMVEDLLLTGLTYTSIVGEVTTQGGKLLHLIG